jgi:mannosyl-oligosaccharide alpha-1,2-mannosidase
LPTQYSSQAAFYAKSGFFITDSVYDLRPEVIESYYYAYRVTGDTKYQDWAWDAFLAINSTCRVGSGFSQINNVNVAGGGGYANNQESFFFAEVMKYAYLIQAEDGPWQVNYRGGNQFVFNTEAHPLRVANLVTYQ